MLFDDISLWFLRCQFLVIISIVSSVSTVNKYSIKQTKYFENYTLYRYLLLISTFGENIMYPQLFVFELQENKNKLIFSKTVVLRKNNPKFFWGVYFHAFENSEMFSFDTSLYQLLYNRIIYLIIFSSHEVTIHQNNCGTNRVYYIIILIMTSKVTFVIVVCLNRTKKECSTNVWNVYENNFNDVYIQKSPKRLFSTSKRSIPLTHWIWNVSLREKYAIQFRKLYFVLRRKYNIFRFILI